MSSISFRVTFRCATCGIDIGPSLNDALTHLRTNPGHRILLSVEPLTGFFK